MCNGKFNRKRKVDIAKVSGCVIATSKGYPLEYKTGFPVNIGKIDPTDCQIFHSGTF